MNKYSLLVLLFLTSGTPLIAKRISRKEAQEKHAKARAEKAKKYEERCYAEFKEIQAQFAPIISSFNKLKASKPKEYGYHEKELKKIIRNDMTAKKFENLFGWFSKGKLKVVGYTPQGFPILEEIKPLERFCNSAIPQTSKRIREKMKYFTNKEHTEEAQMLLSNLESLKNEVCD